MSSRAIRSVLAAVLSGAFLVPALVAPAAHACTIPVFRYALERWTPEPFEAVVFHRGALNAADRAAVNGIGEPANVQVTRIDVSKRVVGDAAKLWAAQSPGGVEPQLPWIVVRHPEALDPSTATIWAGPLEARTLATLLDSPARKQTSNHLLAGQSAVFVLIDGGDKARDEAAEKVLREELKRCEAELKLPVIRPDDPASQLRSKLPLKLAFAVVRVSRTDPTEAQFVRLLSFGQEQETGAKGKHATTKPAEPSTEPVVVPVFGRGRALCTLAGSEIDRERLAEVATFLAGECSCRVKELNPGFDLLMSADWQSILDEGPFSDDPPRQAKGASSIPDPVIGPGKKKQ